MKLYIHYLRKPFYLAFFLLSILFINACSTTPSTTSTTTLTSKKDSSSDHIEIDLAPLSAWTERKFVNSTQYNIKKTAENKPPILIAKSHESASLLFKKIHIDLNQTPFINWQWKVKHIFSKNVDEAQKKGDDFPARIYIAIKPKLGQIKPRALTYVWASHASQFSHWTNPYTKNVEILALQSGPKLTGSWITEKRNLKQDLSNFFGQEIDSIEGIGIMTDTDNSKTSAEAAYTQLFFSQN